VTSAVARSNAAKARTSLVMSPSWDRSSDNTGSESADDVGSRVKFLEEPEIKVMSPVLDDEFPVVDTRSPSPISVASVASSVSSEPSAASVAKVLASRLSFWSKSSKMNSAKTPDVESPRVSVDEEEDRPLDALIHEDMPEPQQVLNSIIETVAPSPATMSQKYAELEAKILRQTVKEFAKGEMYFAYDFGAPIHIPLKKICPPHCSQISRIPYNINKNNLLNPRNRTPCSLNSMLWICRRSPQRTTRKLMSCQSRYRPIHYGIEWTANFGGMNTSQSRSSIAKYSAVSFHGICVH